MKALLVAAFDRKVWLRDTFGGVWMWTPIPDDEPPPAVTVGREGQDREGS